MENKNESDDLPVIEPLSSPTSSKKKTRKPYTVSEKVIQRNSKGGKAAGIQTRKAHESYKMLQKLEQLSKSTREVPAPSVGSQQKEPDSGNSVSQRRVDDVDLWGNPKLQPAKNSRWK